MRAKERPTSTLPDICSQFPASLPLAIFIVPTQLLHALQNGADQLGQNAFRRKLIE
jgi:hypothetical protein